MNRGARLVTLGWSAFIAENVILSENREAIIERVGARNYHRIYNTLSLAACVGTTVAVIRFGKMGGASRPISKRLGTLLTMAGFAGLAQMGPKLQMPQEGKCPIDFSDKTQGIKRITRHPQLMSLGVAGLGAALATPFGVRRIFFAFPILFAFIGGAHQDARKGYDASTSLVPFQALVEGRQKWSDLSSEFRWLNGAAGATAALGVAVGREMSLRRLLKKI